MVGGESLVRQRQEDLRALGRGGLEDKVFRIQEKLHVNIQHSTSRIENWEMTLTWVLLSCAGYVALQ